MSTNYDIFHQFFSLIYFTYYKVNEIANAITHAIML